MVSFDKAGLDAWRTATWLVPLAVNVQLALVIATAWLVGRAASGIPAAALFAFGAVLVLVLVGIVAVLSRKRESRHSTGAVYSLAGSFVVVIIGGLLYGLWVSLW